MALSSHLDDWYVGSSPRNSTDSDNHNGASVEGSWDEWVALAKAILEEDERRTADKQSKEKSVESVRVNLADSVVLMVARDSIDIYDKTADNILKYRCSLTVNEEESKTLCSALALVHTKSS